MTILNALPYFSSSLKIAPVRPVLSRDEAIAIGRKVVGLCRADWITVTIENTAVGVTRVNRRGHRASRDGERVTISLETQFGEKAGVHLDTNQLDDATLRTVIPYLERVSLERMGPAQRIVAPNVKNGPYSYQPVHLWHEPTVDALVEARTARLPEILNATSREGFPSAVFIGASAHAYCHVNRDGIEAYGEETDSEITVTCWTTDYKGSGWGGHAARDWAKIDPMAAAQQAIEIAKRSVNIQAVEPGRHTAILGPAAVAQLASMLGAQFDAADTHGQRTVFSKPPDASVVGERVVDRKLSMWSSPVDPEGGYFPFMDNWPEEGVPQRGVRWIEKGILKQLAYSGTYAASRGVSTVAMAPSSIRIEADESETHTVEEMIAACKRGIYVNRFSSISSIGLGMLTGFTRDGCFLVREGKIDRAVKNFRFIESPWHIFNRLAMVGRSHRVAIGYNGQNWPTPPVIVPPMMVHDFNFAALADAI